MEMDLDAALNELGMLSTVTDSRKDYLNEQAIRRKSSCYNLLQLNPAYVTCVGPVCHPPKPKSKFFDVEEAPKSLRASGSVPHLPTDDKRVCRRQRSKPRYSRPYHIPKHASSTSSMIGRCRRTTEPSEEKEATEGENSLQGSISLDSETMPTVHFLTRSKSVDDLSKKGNAVRVMVNAGVRTQHQELEMVSRHLRDLQVS